MISRNPSSPSSLYPSLLVFRLPPILTFFLEIASFLYLGIRAHQWPKKSELFMLSFWYGRPRYAAAKGNLVTLRRSSLRRSVREAKFPSPQRTRGEVPFAAAYARRSSLRRSVREAKFPSPQRTRGEVPLAAAYARRSSLRCSVREAKFPSLQRTRGDHNLAFRSAAV